MSPGRAPAAQSRAVAVPARTPGRTRCPWGRGPGEEVSGRRWMAARVRHPAPRARCGSPGSGRRTQDLLFRGETSSPRGRVPGAPTSPAAVSAVTRRGAGGPTRSRALRPIARPAPSPRACPALAHSGVEVRAGVAPGLPRPPPRERSPGPTNSPRLRVPPPATRGRGCPELPARRTPSPPTPRALGLSRQPGSPGRPLLEGGFPAESARSWAAPHASPGLALRGLDLESGRRREMPASEREGVGRDGKRGEQERGLRREAGKRRRRRKGARREEAGEKDGREGGSSQAWSLYWAQPNELLADPRAQGRPNPTRSLLAPGLASRPGAH